jgi:hypothetical protein
MSPLKVIVFFKNTKEKPATRAGFHIPLTVGTTGRISNLLIRDLKALGNFMSHNLEYLKQA